MDGSARKTWSAQDSLSSWQEVQAQGNPLAI